MIGLERPGEGSAKVGDVRHDDLRTLLGRDIGVETGGEGDRVVIPGVPLAQPGHLAQLVEMLEGELANRLQHEETAAGERLHEAGLGDRPQGLDRCARDLLGSIERERPGHDGQSREELLQLGRQQVVAPLDRRAERSLPSGRVAGAGGQHGQTVIEPLEQRRRVKRAQTRRCELERQRQPVEAAADLRRTVVGNEIAAH